MSGLVQVLLLVSGWVRGTNFRGHSPWVSGFRVPIYITICCSSCCLQGTRQQAADLLHGFVVVLLVANLLSTKKSNLLLTWSDSFCQLASSPIMTCKQCSFKNWYTVIMPTNARGDFCLKNDPIIGIFWIISSDATVNFFVGNLKDLCNQKLFYSWSRILKVKANFSFLKKMFDQ